MRIWPAIDIKGGKCVRLSQGDFHRDTVYGSSPADMASRWLAEGASALHVIDLDGALGQAPNKEAIAKIADESGVDIQVGGGIRSQEVIEDYLSLGIKRLIVSTKSVGDPDWLASMAKRYEGHLVVSIDTRDGQLAYDGWQKTAEVNVLNHAISVAELPIAGLIYTDIDRAGMMTGPNFELIRELFNNVSVPIIASGGVRNIDDIRRLSETGVEGCIIGRALYDGKVTLPEAISVATASV